MIVNSQTHEPTPVVDEVISHLPEDLYPYHRKEFHATQLEMVSAPCSTAEALFDQLVDNRISASDAARIVDCDIVSIGSPIISGSAALSIDDPRYARMARRYGAVSEDPVVPCGHHTHVGVPSKDLAVEVCRRMRPYLPTLQAMMVNSPYRNGKDTGYSSWRHIAMGSFPNVGIFPTLDDLDDYKDVVTKLQSSELIIDVNNIYWYSRPSNRYPTVEVRIGDAALTAADSAFMAVIVRGLVTQLVSDIELDRPYTDVRDVYLPGAHWVAARQGLEGRIIDFSDMKMKSSWVLVNSLIGKIVAALDSYGDLDFVSDSLSRYRDQGSGAERQRIAFNQGGLSNLLDYVIRETRS